MNLPITCIMFLLTIVCQIVGGASICVAQTFSTNDGPVTVSSFGYQLQGPAPTGELTPGPLAVSSHDLIVMDFARFGDEGSKFTVAEVTDIKNSSPALGGDGNRKVTTAYVSIGEASEFRSNWDSGWTVSGLADSPLTAAAPSWLGPVNPNFPESRKVRYWDTGWQSLIYNSSSTGWLDQVVAQGFDGAYLDIIDAYYFWGAEVTAADQISGDPIDEQDAARRMAEFVVEMTAHARQSNPDFFTIPQNGAYILNDLEFGSNPQSTDPALATAYLDAIGAIGIEDTYYRGDLDENNPLDIDTGKVSVLQSDFLNAGIPVLVTDYINTTPEVDNFFSLAQADGFIAYAAPSRALDSLAGVPASVLLGDVNLDGTVDFLDISPFISILSGGTFQAEADTDENGVVNFLDI